MSALKVAVVGVSGTGKSTFTKRLCSMTGIASLELDSVYHQPNWTPAAPEELRREVFEFMQSHSSWVIDGNYPMVRPSVWTNATHVVWIDLPRSLFLKRILTRSVQRILTQERLWNDNREGVSALFSPDSDKNVWLWALKEHPKLQLQYTKECMNPNWNHIRFVRIRRVEEIDGILEGLSSHFRRHSQDG